MTFLFHILRLVKYIIDFIFFKKSWKIPKRLSEIVNRRRAVNTMAKRKGQKDKLRYILHYTEN